MSVPCFFIELTDEPWSEPNEHGMSSGHYWIRRDTGEKFKSPGLAPVGAMWFATWFEIEGSDPKRYYCSDWDNQTEPPLIVKTPGGDWNVDSRASNCTRREDKLHRCWCRHGQPPNVTVDKNGNTCNAGAGSIQCNQYHGFLRNGVLT